MRSAHCSLSLLSQEAPLRVTEYACIRTQSHIHMRICSGNWHTHAYAYMDGIVEPKQEARGGPALLHCHRTIPFAKRPPSLQRGVSLSRRSAHFGRHRHQNRARVNVDRYAPGCTVPPPAARMDDLVCSITRVSFVLWKLDKTGP